MNRSSGYTWPDFAWKEICPCLKTIVTVRHARPGPELPQFAPALVEPPSLSPLHPPSPAELAQATAQARLPPVAFVASSREVVRPGTKFEFESVLFDAT